MAGYFSVLLVLLTLGSGLIWLIDHLMYAPKGKSVWRLPKHLPVASLMKKQRR